MGFSDKKDEKRKYSRVGFATKIEIRMNDETGQAILLEANSKDLSQRGVFVKTGKRYPIGTECLVNIYLSGGIDDLKLDIHGRIVRHTDIGFGVEFESMDVNTYTHLKTLILYNSEQGE